MQLKDDIESKNALDRAILEFYKENGNRDVRIFLHSKSEDEMEYRTHFLLDRQYVIEYGIGFDRGFWLGGVALGIGPHYFSPSYFWSYEDANRFTLEATTEGVEKNLALLDEFLYKFSS